MKNAKVVLRYIPEIYLICSVIYYWIGTWLLLNPVAIAFLLALILQLIIRNRVTGILISGLFVIINIYLVFALTSELLSMYNEIKTFNNSQKRLLFFGSTYMGLNIIVGVVMFIKYISFNNPSQVQLSA